MNSSKRWWAVRSDSNRVMVGADRRASGPAHGPGDRIGPVRNQPRDNNNGAAGSDLL